jgi:hypothetical protein
MWLERVQQLPAGIEGSREWHRERKVLRAKIFMSDLKVRPPKRRLPQPCGRVCQSRHRISYLHSMCNLKSEDQP